ncbi:hypothetical protein [Streptomyces sp. CAU 1734]|uniref:hypothetical protein n=1 Tax=Streptomyces sp. CAU 1734 TaxID=3140360 RepID=UPI00326110D0
MRSELHRLLGGRLHPRVSPSARTENVFLFAAHSDPLRRLEGFTGHHFHFVGEGRSGGDQQLKGGNATVVRHASEGRTLRLFASATEAESGQVRYLGAWALDADLPFVRTDIAVRGRPDQPSNSVLVFRLLPLTPVPSGLPRASPVPLQTLVSEVDLFAPFRTDPTSPGQLTAIEATAQTLLQDYRDHLRVAGHPLSRYEIAPARTLDRFSVDLLDHARNELIVARGSVARTYVRAALGELSDLTRHFKSEPASAVLLPSLPRGDLVDLCGTWGVSIIYPAADSGFQRREPARS